MRMLLRVILYSFAFTICPRVLSVRFFVKYTFQHLLLLVDLFFGLVVLSFFLFNYLKKNF